MSCSYSYVNKGNRCNCEIDKNLTIFKWESKIEKNKAKYYGKRTTKFPKKILNKKVMKFKKCQEKK